MYVGPRAQQLSVIINSKRRPISILTILSKKNYKERHSFIDYGLISNHSGVV